MALIISVEYFVLFVLKLSRNKTGKQLQMSFSNTKSQEKKGQATLYVVPH